MSPFENLSAKPGTRNTNKAGDERGGARGRRTSKDHTSSLNMQTSSSSSSSLFAHPGPDASLQVDLSALRHLVANALQKNMLGSATFFADKLVTMSQGAPLDVYLLCLAYQRSGQPRRVIHTLRSYGLLRPAAECKV